MDETNHGLDREHRCTKKNTAAVVTNGPFGDIKETIGGFIIVKAESAEEAAAFAKGCPVLQGEGNSVEVRKIAKNDGLH